MVVCLDELSAIILAEVAVSVNSWLSSNFFFSAEKNIYGIIFFWPIISAFSLEKYTNPLYS